MAMPYWKTREAQEAEEKRRADAAQAERDAERKQREAVLDRDRERTRQRLAADRKRSEEEQRKRKERRERLHAESLQRAQDASAAAIEARRVELLQAWRMAGGSPEDFAAQWPRMKLELIERDARQRADDARSAYRDRARRVIG